MPTAYKNILYYIEVNGEYLDTMKNEYIKTKKVHVICWDGKEYDRTTTPWEIAKFEEEGVSKVNSLGELIFDFR